MRPRHSIAVLSPWFLALLTGCGSTPEVGCVIPPATLARSDRQIAFDAAATLNALPEGGRLETDFREAVSIWFGRMSDETTCLFLFLKALECYARDGEIDERTKDVLVEVVRQEWRRHCGLGDDPPTLTEREREVLSQSRHGNMAYGAWRRLGGR